MTTTRLRPAAVAGLFYPDDPDVLRAWCTAELDRAATWIPADEPVPHAVIAPHAGYRYSGRVAASAWARVARRAPSTRRVLLLGPTHRVAVRGLAIPSVDALDTPLGPIAVDGATRELALGFTQVAVDDAPHAQEHSLEVHLPFLALALPGVPVLPLAVGRAEPDEVADVLAACWTDDTVVVVSTDLSHYHPVDEARGLDAATIAAILRLDVEALLPQRACGAMPVRGLLALARRRGLGIAALDACTSGDTAGTADRVVGYASFALWDGPAPEPVLTAADGLTLRELAVAALRHGVATGRPPEVALADLPPRLRVPGAAFVTLQRDGALRGCIGTLEARRPLAVEVVARTVDAARNDQRFPPVDAAELPSIDVSVSVLTPPVPFACSGYDELVAALQPSIDGLVVDDGAHRATFLPSVWDQLPEPSAFVARLWAKAGLPSRHWSGATRVARYRALHA
jgi:MEMO1 family protein